MTDTDILSELRPDLYYEKLIEKASPPLQLYIRTLEQENGRLRQEVMELRQSTVRQRLAASARERRPQSAPAQIETVHHSEHVKSDVLLGHGCRFGRDW